jgi:hypothetical protein
MSYYNSVSYGDNNIIDLKRRGELGANIVYTEGSFVDRPFYLQNKLCHPQTNFWVGNSTNDVNHHSFNS